MTAGKRLRSQLQAGEMARQVREPAFSFQYTREAAHNCLKLTREPMTTDTHKDT